jgi:hypothetical protein
MGIPQSQHQKTSQKFQALIIFANAGLPDKGAVGQGFFYNVISRIDIRFYSEVSGSLMIISSISRTNSG